MNSKEFEFLGISKFHKAGYKGQGIIIASREKESSSHGQKVADILKQVCPEATILYDVDYKDEESNFDIYTTSLSFSSDKLPVSQNKAKQQVDKNRFLVCAIGNNASESSTAISKNEYFKSIGACLLKNNKVSKASYSSVSNDLDYMSLSHLKMSNNKYFDGSSCSAPLFAGMCAILQCFFLKNTGRKLTNAELLDFIKKNCIDLENKGHDSRTGHGLFILPDLEEYVDMKIKLKIDSKIAEVDGKEVELDVAPVILNNRTMVPLRFVAEQFGCKVEWDEKNREVVIEK